MLKNSRLLQIAVALCLANMLFALWSSLASSGLRARVSTAEQAVKDLSSRLDDESKKRSAGFKELEGGLDAQGKRIERLNDEVFPPPPPPPPAPRP